jgi:hypothetical protein
LETRTGAPPGARSCPAVKMALHSPIKINNDQDEMPHERPGLTEQAFVPMRQMLEGLQQAAKTTRAAGEALKEAGELLTQQAAAMDQALSFSSPFLDMTAPPNERSATPE